MHDTATTNEESYFWVFTHAQRPDGTRDSFATVKCPAKRTETPWHGRTVSGYGKRIPTQWLILFNGRWRRVHVAQYGNAGSAYIGKDLASGFRLSDA